MILLFVVLLLLTYAIIIINLIILKIWNINERGANWQDQKE
jgi:hypothetical protein